MLKNDIITHYDQVAIFDKLEQQIRKGIGPLGFVRIFLQTKNGLIYDEGFNLVVAQGREFVAQKIFGSYVYSGGSRTDWTNYKISHFAVGSGGSTIGGGGTVTLNGPYICDTRLLTATSLGTAGYLTEPGGTTLCVKPITASGGSIYLEPQSFSGGGSCTYYTKMKCTCIVPSGEPTSLPAGGTTRIDEAGLYFVQNAGVGPTTNLFAHICFAPKWKEKESTLTIEWYILC